MKSCITKYEELKEALVGESEFSHDELVERAKQLVDDVNYTTDKLIEIRRSLLKVEVHLGELHQQIFDGGLN
tara:strand:+ start:658 stop:873 length:216 start_codon:yes stop_codon:yes gene_type:complete